jgi:hypothetical protein
MTDDTTDDLSSLISQRQAAKQAPATALLADNKEVLHASQSSASRVSDLRGSPMESIGGGLLGKQNLTQLLTDTKNAPTPTKGVMSVVTPKNLSFQLLLVTGSMVNKRETCGGIVVSKGIDCFCARNKCNIQTHKNKHPEFMENTIYVFGSTYSTSNPIQRIYNPKSFNFKLDEDLDSTTFIKKTIKLFNNELIGCQDMEIACNKFNELVDVIMEERAKLENKDLEDSDMNVAQAEYTDQGIAALKTDKDSAQDSDDDSLLIEHMTTADEGDGISRFISNTEVLSKSIDDANVNDDKSPVIVLAKEVLQQQSYIGNLESDMVQLDTDMTYVKKQQTKLESLVHKNTGTLPDRVHVITKPLIADSLSLAMERIDTLESKFGITTTLINSLQAKVTTLESQVHQLQSVNELLNEKIFAESTLQDNAQLNPDTVRSELANINFKLALFDSRIGSEALKFGSTVLKSQKDAMLFVVDHVKSNSYGCFFDLVALLDSLRDTQTDEKTYVDAEYNAHKTKFQSVTEAAISASFLHITPLCFCNTKHDSSAYHGSIDRMLPLVKKRDMWFAQGGMFGLKGELDREVNDKVFALQSEIRETLGSSEGGQLASQFLQASQQCFNDFMNWTESFFQELLAMSQVSKDEAWKLVLQCWIAFFTDLRKIRVSCSTLSLAGLEKDSLRRKEVVAKYIWTMGRAIKLQDEYRIKQFRNHPTISTVINYHLFQHRVPTTVYDTFVHEHADFVKQFNVWKGQINRDIKKASSSSN